MEVLAYDHESLRSLRADFRGRYLFKRENERTLDGSTSEVIYALRLGEESITFGGSPRLIPLNQNLGLAAALMREYLTNSFAKAKSRQLLGYNPLQVLLDPSTDLLHGTTTGECPPWLSARVALDVDTRQFHFEGSEPFVGIVITPRVRRRIARNCSEWIDAGLDIRNFWVCERGPGTTADLTQSHACAAGSRPTMVAFLPSRITEKGEKR